MKSVWRILKRAVREFNSDNAMTLGAALAFYTALSIAPLLVLVLAILGMVYSGENAQQQLVQQVSSMVGESAANAVQSLVRAASRPSIQGIAAAFSAILLLFSASTVFAQLQQSLNRIWNVEAKPGRGLRGVVRKRAVAIGMVFGVAVLLLASLIATTALSFAIGHLQSRLNLPGGALLWQVLNIAVTLLLFGAVFSLMFYYLPDVKLAWRYALVGGFVTALLFTAGKEGLALYLGRESVGSAYGAAGSLFILLLWVYYSSLIFFLGAELTQAYSAEHGEPIVPDEHARFIRDRWLEQRETNRAA